MIWQIIASCAAVVFPAIGILNLYLLNQVRLGVTQLQVQMLEKRAEDNRELRAWVEAEFKRKDASTAVTEALSMRIASLESRRRINDSDR